jgi:hypothetical protein
MWRGHSSRPGDADDARLHGRERHRHVAYLPGPRGALGVVAVGLHGDHAGPVGGADPDHQVIGVGAAAFPQPGPRAGRDDQQLGRVGAGGAPVASLQLQGRTDLGLHRGAAGLVFGHPLAVPAAALPAPGEPVGQHHQRRHRGHHQVQRVAQGHRDDSAERGRKQRGEPRQRVGARGLRLGRQPERGRPGRRQQPGRDIAAALRVSEKAVKNHVNRIFTKLGVRTRVEAVLLWQQAQPG